MASFADYILDEKDYEKKIRIAHMLSKRDGIFFDTSVVVKTDLAKMFVEAMDIKDVDKNLLLTAGLLYACKKDNSHTALEKVQSYAKEGAQYLKTLGFSDKFCKICEGHNRYTLPELKQREKESDILEIIDSFGGMMLSRPDRVAFKVDDAMTLLEFRNLKGRNNRYLEKFKEFMKMEVADIRV